MARPLDVMKQTERFATRTRTGVAILDFGATPSVETSVYVDLPTAIATTRIRAWIEGSSTPDNRERDHMLAGIWLRLTASSVDVGRGFNIKAESVGGLVTGKFNIRWALNR